MTKGVGERPGICVVCSREKEELPSVTLDKCSHIYHLTCLQFAQPLNQRCDSCRTMFRTPTEATSRIDFKVISTPSDTLMRSLSYPKPGYTEMHGWFGMHSWFRPDQEVYRSRDRDPPQLLDKTRNCEERREQPPSLETEQKIKKLMATLEEIQHEGLASNLDQLTLKPKDRIEDVD